MPAPRRKSCIACVKAKRRCDLAIPSCHRCKVKSIVCDYSGTVPSPPRMNGGNAGSDTVHTATSSFPARNSDHPPNDFGIDPAMTFSSSALPATDWNTVSADMISMPAFPDPDLDWPDIMTGIDDFVVPDRIEDNTSIEKGVISGAIYQARVVYALKQMKSYPHLFFTTGQTPFIHRYMYGQSAPVIIQDAISACALYAAKNDENSSLVFRDIERKARDIVASRANPNSSWGSPTEHLAAVQALILYQIMRLFDGDIRLRAEAEADEPVLLQWTHQLKARIQPLITSPQSNGSGADSTSPVPKNSLVELSTGDWRAWIFAETLRRTVIMSYALQGMYTFLRQGWDASHHDINPLSFTAQSALWNAPNEYHWRNALQKQNPLVVCFATWTLDLVESKPSDMEDLGVMMLVLMRGVDGASEWLGEENLEQFKLDWTSIKKPL